jgi:hypothetical protein
LDKSNELRRQSLPVREDGRQMAGEVTDVACGDYLALRIQYVCGRWRSFGLWRVQVRDCLSNDYRWTGDSWTILRADRRTDGRHYSGVEQGESEHAGARGSLKSKTYSFKAPVGFGPFSLPAGQGVDRLKAESPDDKRFANIGNGLFAEMKLTILLNYRAKKLTFYGSCPAS